MSHSGCVTSFVAMLHVHNDSLHRSQINVMDPRHVRCMPHERNECEQEQANSKHGIRNPNVRGTVFLCLILLLLCQGQGNQPARDVEHVRVRVAGVPHKSTVERGFAKHLVVDARALRSIMRHRNGGARSSALNSIAECNLERGRR